MKLQKTTKNHNSEKEEKNLEVPCYCKTTVIKTGWYWQQNKTKQNNTQNQTKTKTPGIQINGQIGEARNKPTLT